MLTKKTAAMFFAGALVALAVAFTIGATRSHESGPESGVGRFQMSSSGTYAWVIDTVTGQVWSNSDSRSVEQFDKVKVPSTQP